MSTNNLKKTFSLENMSNYSENSLELSIDENNNHQSNLNENTSPDSIYQFNVSFNVEKISVFNEMVFNPQNREIFLQNRNEESANLTMIAFEMAENDLNVLNNYDSEITLPGKNDSSNPLVELNRDFLTTRSSFDEEEEEDNENILSDDVSEFNAFNMSTWLKNVSNFPNIKSLYNPLFANFFRKYGITCSSKHQAIKKILSHKKITPLTDIKIYFDILLFYLSKIFNFKKILNSDMFIYKEVVNPNGEDASHLKKLLERTLTYLDYFGKFKKKIIPNCTIRSIKNYSIFNDKKLMLIIKKYQKSNEENLILMFDLDLIHEFYLFKLSLNLNPFSEFFTLSVANEENNEIIIKNFRIKSNLITKLRYIIKKSPSELLKASFKLLLKQFNIHLKKLNKPLTSLKTLYNKNSNEFLEHPNENFKTIGVAKLDPEFREFLKSFDYFNLIFKVIWTNPLNHIHLREIINSKFLSPKEYFLIRYMHYQKHIGKKLWSLCEWIRALDWFLNR